jgi:hypothetical protein
LTDTALAVDLSSNNVTVIVVVAISNTLSWQWRSGARNQFRSRELEHINRKTSHYNNGLQLFHASAPQLPFRLLRNVAVKISTLERPNVLEISGCPTPCRRLCGSGGSAHSKSSLLSSPFVFPSFIPGFPADRKEGDNWKGESHPYPQSEFSFCCSSERSMWGRSGQFHECHSLSWISFDSHSRLIRIESYAFSYSSLDPIEIRRNVEIRGSFWESLLSISSQRDARRNVLKPAWSKGFVTR